MISISIILTAFVLVFIAELGDKTQLVAFSLTSSTKNPLIIFLATSSALVLSSVISAILGGVAYQFLAKITGIISAVLFLIFGIYMLLSKEMPRIKDCFLKTISIENTLFKMLPEIFKKSNIYHDRIETIIKEEQGHADLFRVLLKEKKLFKDDINESDKLEKLVDQMKVNKKALRSGVKEAIDEIMKIDQACLDIYKFMSVHLEEEHHAEEPLKNLLKNLISEEEGHIRYFTEIRTDINNGKI